MKNADAIKALLMAAIDEIAAVLGSVKKFVFLVKNGSFLVRIQI